MKDLVARVKMIDNWNERHTFRPNENVDQVPENLGPEFLSICSSCMVPGGGCDDKHYLCGLRAEKHIRSDGTHIKPAQRISKREQSRRDEYFRYKRELTGELIVNCHGQIELL